MVVHEIVVSVLATYASSEYLHGSRQRAIAATLAALAANALVFLPAALSPALGLKQKLPLVALTFLAALYADTVACRKQLTGLEFVVALQQATALLVPLFPLFSVAFAFFFLEIGELCEHVLGMSDASISAWLNRPIYYGVLYGPFAYVFVRVKAIARASTPLPRAVGV